MSFLLKGLLIGFSIAAPVGPIGALCIRRSLVDGRLLGFVTGLGAATADALYGCVAAFGVTAVSDFLVEQKASLGLFGGLFLCYLGVSAFFTRPNTSTVSSSAKSLVAVFGSTLFLTLTNPTTILSFIAVFAAVSLGNELNLASSVFLVVGVFFGSTLWWLVLSNGVFLLRSRLKENSLKMVNRLSGAVVFAFGLYALIQVFRL